jgi:hypothetical protein
MMMICNCTSKRWNELDRTMDSFKQRNSALAKWAEMFTADKGTIPTYLSLTCGTSRDSVSLCTSTATVRKPVNPSNIVPTTYCPDQHLASLSYKCPPLPISSPPNAHCPFHIYIHLAPQAQLPNPSPHLHALPPHLPTRQPPLKRSAHPRPNHRHIHHRWPLPQMRPDLPPQH